jgi:tetratricopeptide (TPR) repeat protein/tRNA A-37 threonylcarbamoyl transferase component Bud32
MTPPQPNPLVNTDRNLLFGILALQMDFISRDALIAAMHAWVLDKARPLGQILVDQGSLTLERHTLLHALVREHLKAHHDDPQQSLAALATPTALPDQLGSIADADLQASLGHVRLPIPDPDQTVDALPPGDAAGSRYRVLRPHARGGLGEVFVALDLELHRQVAWKSLQDRYVDDSGSRARFLLEGEITGSLEHPGIVPIYGLGCTANGRPYYAMRFIQGDSLKQAIEQFHQAEGANRDPGARALAFRRLLERFVDVCNAVAYAHSRGVLHRDLKPANVMLGKFGETLVVDWGLAKPLGHAEASEGPLLPSLGDGPTATQAGQTVGTPAYMSPEQATGQPELLGPATDIYGLGATLYTLLTGHIPVAGPNRAAVLERVARGEWPQPRQRNKEVPAPLEAICLKAMALRPEQRYVTALELAGEVEHWLADEPVAAYAEPWRLRAGRWLRHHRTLAASTATAFLALVLLGGGGWWWLARQQAARAEATARGVNQALDEAARLWVQARANEADRARWTEALSAARRAESLLAAGSGDPDLHRRVQELGTTLEQEATAAQARAAAAAADRNLLDRLAEIRSQRGDEFSKADTDADYARAFRDYGIEVEALDPQEVAARIRARPPVVGLALTAALDDWALDRRQRLPGSAGWQRLLQVARAADPDAWRDRLRATLVSKDLPGLRRLMDEARPGLLPLPSVQLLGRALLEAGDAKRAVALLSAVREQHPGDVWVNYDLAQALRAQQPPQLAEAIRYYTAAQALRPEIAHALGHALQEAGRPDEATAVFRQLTQLRPRNQRHHNCLAGALSQQGRVEEAKAEYRKAIALDPKFAGPHYNLGVVLRDQGQLEEAKVEYRKAIELDPKFAYPHIGLGNVLRAQDRLEEAKAEYRKASELDPKDANPHNGLGNVLHDQSRLEEAKTEYRKASELDPKFAYPHHGLGNVLYAQGRLEEAKTEYRKASELDPKFAHPHDCLGVLLRDQGQLEEAKVEFHKAMALGDQDAAVRIHHCDRLLTLTWQLPAVLKGEIKLRSAAERLEFADLCVRPFQQRYGDATRLYAEAFAADPKLADDLNSWNRYNAACAAALAAAGQGKDPTPPDDKEKARLRNQALEWLQADLALWSKQAQSAQPQDRATVLKMLRHWQRDRDLASVRDANALAKLAPAEREAWRKLWAAVEALLAKAEAPAPPAKEP